jgi:hypothetical protein
MAKRLRAVCTCRKANALALSAHMEARRAGNRRSFTKLLLPPPNQPSHRNSAFFRGFGLFSLEIVKIWQRTVKSDSDSQNLTANADIWQRPVKSDSERQNLAAIPEI